MTISEKRLSEKATPFEIEIFAEMHNIINVSDEVKATKANIIILTKLISVVKSLETKDADIFVNRLRKATDPNIQITPTKILGSPGWELKDLRGGLSIPSTPQSFETAMHMFLQLQHRKINTELNIIIMDVLHFLMEHGIFHYNAERDGDLYRDLLTGTQRSDYPDE